MAFLRLDRVSESSLADTNPSTPAISPVSVLSVDDHALIRAAMSQVLSSHREVKQVVSSQNYAEAEAHASRLHPDIIWLDMHVADFDSIAEIHRLRRLSSDSRIMALADVEDEQEAFAAIMAGAQGYRSKQDVEFDDIMLMIHALCRGEFVLRAELLTRVMQRLRSAALPLWGTDSGLASRVLLRSGDIHQLVHLTTREREILQLISQELRDRDIAKGLHISEKTVQKHVQSILSKLGAQNRTEAAYLIHHQSSL